jgi:hypothetical protein
MRDVNAPPGDAEVPDVPSFVAAPKGWAVPTGVRAPPIGNAELFPIMPPCAAAPTDMLAAAPRTTPSRARHETFSSFSILLTLRERRHE